LAADAPAFALLRRRMPAQDRFYAVAPIARLGLTYKIASVTGLPSITDYEPQTSRRFAELEVMMRLGRPMARNDDYNLRFTHAPQNRRILDLLAARYLLVDSRGEPLPVDLQVSLREVATAGAVGPSENPPALPPHVLRPRRGDGGRSGPAPRDDCRRPARSPPHGDPERSAPRRDRRRTAGRHR